MTAIAADKNRGQQGIQSLETGVRLYQTLHGLRRPASLTELAMLSRMPPAKVHRYCVSLIRTGLMQRDGRGLYGVGPYGLQLSAPGTEVDQAISFASTMLSQLVQETKETCFLSRWGQRGPVIIKVEDAPKPISIRPTTKGDLPLTNSSTGRVFAAFMEKERLERLVELEFESLRRDEKLSRETLQARRQAFERRLTETRKRVLARTTGERYPSVVSFSAPIFDSNGHVILAFTSFGMATMFPSAWDSPVARALHARAISLTRRIGGSWPAPTTDRR
jgi:DNA-binding IclR family transcriptional regulator